MKIRKIIALIVLLAAVGSMVYAAPKLLEAQQVYNEGNDLYDHLRDIIWYDKNRDTDAQSAAPLDFGILKSESKDAAAWLYSPSTVIDYPVMKATDYDYYLHHLADGTKNANGTLFIDYNNASDFSDPLTVIYGHHMKNGAMFGSLKGYKNQSYFGEHPVMYLYTEQSSYRIELIYGCVIAAGEWKKNAFMFSENLDSFISYASQNTTFKSNTAYTKGDRIVAMSTCSYEFDEARYVVLGILKEI